VQCEICDSPRPLLSAGGCVELHDTDSDEAEGQLDVSALGELERKVVAFFLDHPGATVQEATSTLRSAIGKMSIVSQIVGALTTGGILKATTDAFHLTVTRAGRIAMAATKVPQAASAPAPATNASIAAGPTAKVTITAATEAVATHANLQTTAAQNLHLAAPPATLEATLELHKHDKIELSTEPPKPQATTSTPAGLAVVAIRNLNANVLPAAVEGNIISRVDYKRAPPDEPLGFQVRVRDVSGRIDVKFFSQAADNFRKHPALQSGNRIRLEGFYLYNSDEKYAPPGQQWEMRYSKIDHRNAKISLLCGATATQPVLSVGDVLRSAEIIGAQVDVEGWVLVVGELEKKLARNGNGNVDFRSVWLTDSVSAPQRQRLQWALWDKMAQQFNPGQLSRQRVRITQGLVGAWRGTIQLTGGKLKILEKPTS